MPLGLDPRTDKEPRHRFRLDGVVLVTCLLAVPAAVGCAALSAWYGYDFARLLLDRGSISARNAALFAACAWLAAALALGLGCGLLVRLMYRINGSAAEPADAVRGQGAQGRRAGRPGRRR